MNSVNKLPFSTKIFLLFHFLLRFVTPIFAVFAVATAKKVNVDGKECKKVRDYLSWFDTPDENGMPFGRYEPTVVKIEKLFGGAVADWYWLGLRNQAQGFLWQKARLVPKKMKEMNIAEKINHRMFNERILSVGKYNLIAGWETVKSLKGEIVAIPRVTIKTNDQLRDIEGE